MRLGLMLLCAGLFAGSPALAQDHDPAAGRKIAEADCTSCHAINRADTSPSPRVDAPPFQSIANMSSANELSLRVFLRTSHGGMPNVMLNETETDQVIAYILSLKESGK